MSTSQNPEEFYKKLKIQLDDTTDFPALYMYKFIVPTSKEKVDQVVSKFDNLGAFVETKQSKTGKYTSITIQVRMSSSDAVIEKYKEVSVVEGVISL